LNNKISGEKIPFLRFQAADHVFATEVYTTEVFTAEVLTTEVFNTEVLTTEGFTTARSTRPGRPPRRKGVAAVVESGPGNG